MIVKSEPTDIVIPLQLEDTKIRRRKGVMIDVLLPTKRQVYGNDLPVFENASDFVDKNLKHLMKNEEKPVITVPYPKVEIKREEMLSDEVVNLRLAGVPSYEVGLDPDIRDVKTTRQFTSQRWGGNTQSTFPSIRSEMLKRHGMDDFVYLNLFFNPHAPQWPGAPGLFFRAVVDFELPRDWPGIERVLVRLDSNCWWYVGQYWCTVSQALSTDEWKSQAPKVIHPSGSTQGWGIEVRAKIVLRKRLGRDPTAQEFEAAIQSREKFPATPEEVHHAFDEGHAFIQAWVMTCVGYDENFQREIAAGNAARN